MGFTIFILLFLTGVLCIHFIAKKSNVSRNFLWIIWTIKLGCSIFYVYIYSTYYGEGDRIQGDALHFLEDSKILTEYAYENPAGYLKFLVGLDGSSEEILINPLAGTNIWDYGDNGDLMNDNRLIIRINSIIHFFSFGDVYVHVIVFSFFGFMGSLLFYLSFEKRIEHKKMYLLAIFLLPTIGFFGSGITKESIVILSLGMLVWSLQKILVGSYKLKSVLVLVVAILISLLNKPYVGLVVIPMSSVLFFGKWMQWKKISLLLFTVGIISVAIFLSYIPGQYNLVEKISHKQKDMINVAKGGIFFVTDSSFCAFDYRYVKNFEMIGVDDRLKVVEQTPGEYKLFGKPEFYPFTIPASDSVYEIYLVNPPSNSYFESTRIDNNALNLLKSIPECLVNTLVRPYPTDSGSNLKFVIIGQNWLVLLFMFYVLIRSYWYPKTIHFLKPESQFWVYYLSASAFILLLIIGWTSPVFGAIVRYKIPVYLFLITSLFILYKSKKNVAEN